MSTLIYTDTLTVMVCNGCGITFAMPEPFRKQRQADGGTWYCPNGHGRVYRKSLVTELEEKLATERKNTEFWRDQERRSQEEAAHEKRRAAAYKGQVTRVRNGVCPYCNRSFANVRAHMESKHSHPVAGDTLGEAMTEATP